MKFLVDPILSLIICLLLGAIHTASFAPFSYWWLQLFTLGGLYWYLTNSMLPSHSFLRGLCFGLGWFLTGTSWVFISMHEYGGLPVTLAGMATVLFCATLALFPAFVGMLFHSLRSYSKWLDIFAFAACWALGEALRSVLFTGFPWITTGSAYTSSWLKGYAPIIGNDGLSLLAALIAPLFIQACQSKCGRILRIALLAIVFISGYGLSHISFTHPYGKPITVRLLQGNIPQDLKFNLQHFHDSFNVYGRLITQQPAQLIATPETALPQLWNQIDPNYLAALYQFINSNHTHLVLGVAIGDNERHYTNSAIHLTPQIHTTRAPVMTRYDKSHLVPFGEFVPVGFHWFVDAMHIPLGDFERGKKHQPPFDIEGQRIAVNICYEDLFGTEIIHSLQGDRPATILLNLSNIAWFGDSIALPQHLQASQMRALETGRPMLRATNTGITAIIAPDGKVGGQLAPHTIGSLTGKVQGRQGLTPYSRWGNKPTLFLIAAILLGMLGLKYKNRSA